MTRTTPRAPEPPADVPLAEVVRGAHVESSHRGSVAVVWSDGRTWTAGDAATPVWMRSAVKPLQALPLLERGIADRFGFGAQELALFSASHDGTEDHVAVVDGVLRRAGLTRDDLGCGPHAPFDKAASLAIARAGGRPERIHNNCSGKHAGFLLLAQELGAPLDRYLEPDAPGQVLVRESVAAMAGVDPASLAVAVDGCGAPTFRLPLAALAAAFCRLVNPDGLPDVRARSCDRLLDAISAEPVLLSGAQRLCAALIRSAPGRVYPKNGAEGVYAVGVRPARGPGFGLAIKVQDGAERGYIPAVVHLLARLGLWSAVPESLAEFATVPIHNTQRRVVGAVRSALELPAW